MAKRSVIILALCASTVSSANAPLDHVVALVQSAALRHVVYLERDGELVLLASETAAATLQIKIDAFGNPKTRLVAATVTSSLPTQHESIEYLVHVGLDGRLAVVCTLVAGSRVMQPTCGAGSHRTIAIAMDPTDDDTTRFVVTRREFADFSESTGVGCRDNTPITYEPTVTRYQIAPGAGCTIVP